MPIEHDADTQLWTPKRAAAELELTTGTLANWRASYGQDRLPYILLNRRDVRYFRRDVLAFIAARVAATPQASREASQRRRSASPPITGVAAANGTSEGDA